MKRLLLSVVCVALIAGCGESVDEPQLSEQDEYLEVFGLEAGDDFEVVETDEGSACVSSMGPFIENGGYRFVICDRYFDAESEVESINKIVVSVPDSFSEMDMLTDFAGYGMDEESFSFEVTGKAYSFWDESLDSPMVFSIMSIDSGDIGHSAIPTDEKLLLEAGGRAYYGSVEDAEFAKEAWEVLNGVEVE